MKAQEFIHLLKGVRPKGKNQWMACCPAHDDHDPSLSVTEHQDRVLIKCWAGCDALSIVNSLGLTLGDLFHEKHDYTPPHAFAQREIAQRKQAQSKQEQAVTFLAVVTAALKRGDVVPDADIQRARKAKSFLQSQGAV